MSAENILLLRRWEIVARGNNGKRGRPIGYKLSEESKRAIAESKRGQRHREETKDKISKSLIIYFKQFNSLGDEVTEKYCRIGNDRLCEWANDVKEELDEVEDVLTEKRMRNTRKIELCCGNDIERFAHGATPELLIMLKQLLSKIDDAENILKELL